ncbi:AraC-like ligand-binding domain-containing protein [Verminephrobacter eiseniae]|uniref:Transcriptional regulator, AraC-family n=1 Tax=Verminephrobacter eiseniae (strain EF01-2) TaxID=391735 RepID=A1WQK0_VEREI|nr:AraC family transcriptional regulator [Verminephrobacter eiseniae]ABM59907.1 transcriptional regulator, AraC-family [Verminephrobacter eiseniae EF01-2]
MPHALTGETGALLRQHALFTSQDIEEIRARVGAALNEHCLQPSGSSLAARFYGIEANALSVCLLEYGDAVTVETQPAQDFLLVQTALSGRVGITCREGHWTVRPGCTAWFCRRMCHFGWIGRRGPLR